MLLLLVAMLLVLGYSSWRKATGKRIEAAFTTGVFSPVRAEYGSAVGAEQMAEIERREAELRNQLETEAACWRAASIAIFVSTLGPLSRLWLLSRERERQSGRCRTPLKCL
jgi:hypothetical protein